MVGNYWTKPMKGAAGIEGRSRARIRYAAPLDASLSLAAGALAITVSQL
jgi:hypothetical protein